MVGLARFELATSCTHFCVGECVAYEIPAANLFVDAWQLNAWEAYRDVSRLGLKTRPSEEQRAGLWAILEKVRLDSKPRG